MANTGFNFQQFIDDSKAALMSPKEFFTSMPGEGGFGEPVIKAVIYGLIAGVFHFIWSLLNLTPSGGMMFGGGVGIMALVSSLIFAVIGLFIGGVILLIISAICGGNTNFELSVRATAAMMVLSPIGAFLSFLSGFSLSLGMIVSMAVSLYGIWMMFNALTTALQAKEGTAKIVSIILAAILVLTLIGALTCARTSSTIADKYSREAEDVMKKIESNEEMNESLKKMQKALENLNNEQK